MVLDMLILDKILRLYTDGAFVCFHFLYSVLFHFFLFFCFAAAFIDSIYLISSVIK
jgi:hypothetical protein